MEPREPGRLWLSFCCACTFAGLAAVAASLFHLPPLVWPIALLGFGCGGTTLYGILYSVDHQE